MLVDSANCGGVRKDGRVEQIVLAGGQMKPDHPPILVTIYDIQSDTWARGRKLHMQFTHHLYFVTYGAWKLIITQPRQVRDCNFQVKTYQSL